MTVALWHGYRTRLIESAIDRASIEAEVASCCERIGTSGNWSITSTFRAVRIHTEHVIDFLLTARLSNENRWGAIPRSW